MILDDKDDDKEEGYIGKMIASAMDNFQVNVSNIHLRYEDDVTIPNVNNEVW